MPELPEVETMRRGLLEICGSAITDLAVPRCDLKPISMSPRLVTFRKRVLGKNILTIERAGKRVVLRLSNQDAIVFEPRMTGLVLLADPPTVDHLRCRFDLQGKRRRQLWYWDRRGLGSVRLFSPAGFERQFGADKLGPDALEITAAELQQRLEGSRRAVKVALLDQRAIAGVGNLYASEILHQASVHPEKACTRLSTPEWSRIHQSMLQILEEAIYYEGSTLSDGTYRNALNKSGGYQNHHRVYDREGKACLNCQRGIIRRIVQVQRSTFFCPSCQRQRAPSSKRR